MQVRVVHQGALHLPVRVGVFAVSHADRERILEWLPPDFLPVEERLRKRGIEMWWPKKGGLERWRTIFEDTVLSHIFQYPEDKV